MYRAWAELHERCVQVRILLCCDRTQFLHVSVVLRACASISCVRVCLCQRLQEASFFHACKGSAPFQKHLLVWQHVWCYRTVFPNDFLLNRSFSFASFSSSRLLALFCRRCACFFMLRASPHSKEGTSGAVREVFANSQQLEIAISNHFLCDMNYQPPFETVLVDSNDFGDSFVDSQRSMGKSTLTANSTCSQGFIFNYSDEESNDAPSTWTYRVPKSHCSL